MIKACRYWFQIPEINSVNRVNSPHNLIYVCIHKNRTDLTDDELAVIYKFIEERAREMIGSYRSYSGGEHQVTCTFNK